MALSDKLSSKRVQRLRAAAALPTDSMDNLFTAKGPDAEPQQASILFQDEMLWASWDMHCQSHGYYCSLWSAKLLERQALDARIAKGRQYVADHADSAEALTQLNKLESAHADVTVAMATLDEVIANEALQLGQIEDRIRKAKGLTEPAFICGRCRRLIVKLEDHAQECLEGWARVVAAYDELKRKEAADVAAAYEELKRKEAAGT
jgi:hypothetical protein